MKDIKEGKKFQIGDIEILAIYTPGHITDHMSFLMNYQHERILFSGDIILDSPSTLVQDLPTYMKTLYRLRDTPEFTFDFICTTHSLDLGEGSDERICMPGPAKLDAYIKYREIRLENMLQIIRDAPATREQLYEAMYGDRNLQGQIRGMAYVNLDQQI